MSLKSKVKIKKLFQVDEKIWTFDSTDAELLFTGSVEEPSSYYAELYRTKKGYFVFCTTDSSEHDGSGWSSDSKDYNVNFFSKKEAMEFCIREMPDCEVTKIFKDEIEEL